MNLYTKRTFTLFLGALMATVMVGSVAMAANWYTDNGAESKIVQVCRDGFHFLAFDQPSGHSIGAALTDGTQLSPLTEYGTDSTFVWEPFTVYWTSGSQAVGTSVVITQKGNTENKSTQTVQDCLVSPPTAFNYQGQLTDSDALANGSYDLEFKLFAAESGANQIDFLNLSGQDEGTIRREDVSVVNGQFAVTLDFGDEAFTGPLRWLEISVRPGNSTGTFTVLSPRQPLHPSPQMNFDIIEKIIANKFSDGMVINQVSGHGIYLDSAGIAGVYINNTGDHGIDIVNTGSDGIRMGQIGDDGIQIDKTTQDGYIITEAGTDGFRVCSAGAGPCDDVDRDPPNFHGVEVGDAREDGVHVIDAGRYGVYAKSRSGTAGFFDGNIEVTGAVNSGGADLAERFDVTTNGADGKILPGMITAIDPNKAGGLRIADRAYDRMVAGVISGAGDLKPGIILSQPGTIADGEYDIALTGRVYAWADASFGAIQPGDLLTTSSTPGHAMRVAEYDRAQGAILGKAMTRLDEGTGLVLILITLQ